uniref:SAM domain-containing protein n=1 Tax=Knipowitschia caucasica TaxID=637954 RepID=A0AAV2M852_KNICA
MDFSFFMRAERRPSCVPWSLSGSDIHTDSSVHRRQKALVTDMCYNTDISSLANFGSPDCALGKVLLREEVVQLQEEVQLLRQMKDVLSHDIEDARDGGSTNLLSAAQLRTQLGDKEQELDRAKEALQAMKADRKRLKVEKSDLVSQMQQLYSTLESREEQLREFIRNYDQHRKESEDAVKVLAKEKDLLEREKWDLRRQTKESTETAVSLRSQIDLKENRIKELEAELTMAKQSLATLTKDVPKRHSLAMPMEPVVNGSQEWVMHPDLPLTAAIRQSQQTLYHSHTTDRPAVVRISPGHSRQPSVISDASVADGDRSSTPSDINSPRHRTHSLCNSMEDLEDQKRKKKKEKMTLGSLSRVFTRSKQRKSLEPGLFDDTDSLSQSLSDGEEERQQQAELSRTTCMSQWRAGTVQAWLDLVLGMSMYSRACADNVKSGKVLLGMTDDDLEHGLGISNCLHRRKLRLAIEDYRRAEGDQGLVLSKASDLDHHWVCSWWLCEVGLPQYSQVFLPHLIDGRVLNSLNRRDLERCLNISDPFHQTSLLLAIQLLQMLGFDKEVLQARRAACEQLDRDPIVWTCQRVIKWVRDIDLKVCVLKERMCSSPGLCRGSGRSPPSSSGATGSGAHYALCALGVGLIALGIVMIVWTVIPLDGENTGKSPTTPAANSTEPMGEEEEDDEEEEKDRTKSSSVAMVLVGVGAAMLLLSICLGVRSKRRARDQSNQPVQTGVPFLEHVAGGQGEPVPDPASYNVPSYEEAVGSGNYPVRQSNLRNSMTHLPSYEDIIAAVENEGNDPAVPATNNNPPSEDTPLNSPAPDASEAPGDPSTPERNPSLPARSSSRVSRLLQPLRVRRIKSDKLHLKDFRLQIRSPTTNPVTIEPITPPPGYENKMPELNQS